MSILTDVVPSQTAAAAADKCQNRDVLMEGLEGVESQEGRRTILLDTAENLQTPRPVVEDLSLRGLNSACLQLTCL